MNTLLFTGWTDRGGSFRGDLEALEERFWQLVEEDQWDLILLEREPGVVKLQYYRSRTTGPEAPIERFVLDLEEGQ